MTMNLVNKSCGLVWTIIFSQNQQNSINILELVKTPYTENKQVNMEFLLFLKFSGKKW